ncbi:uncharacterized protein LAESUDRAFT_756222 [Laetiporus sulphureus 93-53]|uniref:C2H2-type domain-containing protein n=1 Tax=Laetiporus sulphureus 93-53 TaxID=1314785 RepID=A0A165G9D3_9APHY|nr:uncharacterized protein LAESUDRAFT_756222 [Laetiporus sulphureus 93-53]KZT10017.1 hypothetical protein LAESUDRAFT_756222 [Laetiporus sulphureus 93-53]
MSYNDASVAHDASSSTYCFDHILSLNEPRPSLWDTLLQGHGVLDVYTAPLGIPLASTSEPSSYAVDISIPQLDEGWASNLSYEEASMDDNTWLMPHSYHMPSVPEAVPSLTTLRGIHDAVCYTKEPSTINPMLLSIPSGKIVQLASPTTAFASCVPSGSISPPIDSKVPSDHAIGTLYATDHTDANTYDRERALKSDATNSDEGSNRTNSFPEPSHAAGYRPLTTNLPFVLNAEIPEELIVFALQDPSRGCPVDGCAYVPTAIGKRGSGQASNMLRHIESHRPKQWVCCGLPLNVAIEKGLRKEDAPPNFFYGGQPMIGGCVHYLSRKDSLVRHLKGKGRDCLTDISIVEEHIKERRASL